MIRRGVLVLVLLAIVSGLPASSEAREEEWSPRLNPVEGALRVLDAYRADDLETIRQGARSSRPDPILVAEHLVLIHGLNAEASERADAGKALTAFVEAAAGSSNEKALKHFQEVWRTFDQEDYERAVRLQSAANAVARAFYGFRKGQERGARLVKVREDDLAADAGATPSGICLALEAGKCLLALDRAKEALAYERPAAKQAVEAGWHPQAARLLEHQARVHARLQDGTAAIEAATAALEAHRRFGRPLGVIWGQIHLAEMHQFVGNLKAGLTVAKQAVDAAEHIGDHQAISLAVSALGQLQRSTGNLIDATATFERSIELLPKAGYAPLIPQEMVRLGSCHAQTGRIAEAIRCFEGALGSEEARLNPNLRDDARRNLASLYALLGDTARAESILAKTEQGTPFLDDARALNAISLGEIYYRSGQHEKSLASFTRAYERFRKTARRRDGVMSLLGMGRCYLALERHEEARDAAEKARAAAAEQRSRRRELDAMLLLADIDLARGRIAPARRGYEACLRGLLDAGYQSSSLSQVRAHLARLYLKDGDVDAAHDQLQTALTERLRAVRGLDQRASLGLRGRLGVLAQLGTEIAVARESPTEAFGCIEAGRGLLLAEAIVNQRALLTADVPAAVREAEAVARREMQRAQRAYLQAAFGGRSDPRAVETTRARFESARTELDRAVDRLEREGQHAASVAPTRSIALTTFQEALPDNTAYVAYQETPAAWYALVVRRDAAELIRLGTDDAIDGRIERYLTLAATPGARETKLAGQLYDDLLRPLESALGSAERLLISPTGRACFLPFAALLRTGDDEARAIERWEIACTPSATVWHLTNQTPLDGRGLLAVADPVYPEDARVPNAHLAVVTRGLGGLPRLPESGAEAEAVGALYPKRERTLLLREDASLDAFRDHLTRQRGRLACLHFACHAFVNGRHPRSSGLVLSGGSVLSVDELYRMDIPADLVVLSACDTGRGSLARGEGVVGLTRGFMHAGVPRVIVSSWKVEDAATKAFMIDFHRQLHDGKLTPAAALRAVQRERLEAEGKGAHPAHWAAFVFWGDPTR